MSKTLIGPSMEGPFSVRSDDDSDNKRAFYGMAEPGASEGDAVWRIFTIDEGVGGDGDFYLVYADGDAAFDNVWTNRTTLTYS